MGCLIFGIILGVVGIMSISVGIEAGDTLLTILGIAFVLPAILAILAMIFADPEKVKKDQEEAKKKFDDKVNEKFEEANFNVSQQYISPIFSIVAIDEDNKKVGFLESIKIHQQISYIRDNVDYKKVEVFSYKDILESEVIIDGETVTKTSRSSQIGGAILGGILAGGVGAVIGGLSGKTASKEQVKTIQLKIIVNDTQNPLQTIPFLNEPNSIDRSNQKFIKANKEVMHWHSLFKVIIDMADKEEKSKQAIQDNKSDSNSSYNTADEIRKLYDLLKEGIISQEEFDLQKKKIIS